VSCLENGEIGTKNRTQLTKGLVIYIIALTQQRSTRKGGESSLIEEIEEIPDPENWLGIRQASQEYDVAISYLYKLAYDPKQPVRVVMKVTKGKIRREVLFYKPDLDRWEENRPPRFKRKDTKTEQPGRMSPATAGA